MSAPVCRIASILSLLSRKRHVAKRGAGDIREEIDEMIAWAEMKGLEVSAGLRGRRRSLARMHEQRKRLARFIEDHRPPIRYAPEL